MTSVNETLPNLRLTASPNRAACRHGIRLGDVGGGEIPDADGTPDSPALRLWCTLAPRAGGEETIRALEVALSQPGPFSGTRWDLAVIQPEVAVARGIEFLHARGAMDGAEADRAMSALLVHALRGDPTTSLVLAHGLAALAHGRQDAERLMALSDGWARRRRALCARRRRRASSPLDHAESDGILEWTAGGNDDRTFRGGAKTGSRSRLSGFAVRSPSARVVGYDRSAGETTRAGIGLPVRR